MRTFFVLMALAVSSPVVAQVEIRITPPSVVFEIPPPLVVITPGVQVVPNHDEEVFYVDGFYWYRRDASWFRARDHRGGWVLVKTGIPVALIDMPAGRYRHYKAHGHTAPARASAYRDDDHDKHERGGKGKGRGKGEGKGKGDKGKGKGKGGD